MIKCYYRFDQNFHGSGLNNARNSSGSSSNQGKNSTNLAHIENELPLEKVPLEFMLTYAKGKVKIASTLT